MRKPIYLACALISAIEVRWTSSEPTPQIQGTDNRPVQSSDIHTPLAGWLQSTSQLGRLIIATASTSLPDRCPQATILHSLILEIHERQYQKLLANIIILLGSCSPNALNHKRSTTLTTISAPVLTVSTYTMDYKILILIVNNLKKLQKLISFKYELQVINNFYSINELQILQFLQSFSRMRVMEKI